MDTAHALSAVPAIHPRLAVVSPEPVERPHQWWSMGALVLSGAMVGVTAVGAMTVREQLDQIASRAEQHARAAQSQVEGMKVLEARMVDLRRAVSSHAREEALFLKMLIIRPTLDPVLARRIASAVQAECLLYGQDPNLMLAIIAVESGFNPGAVSSSGAIGLMQVMPLWKKTLEVDDLTNPEVSIRAGVQIFAHYQQMFRDEARALAAYNMGPGVVEPGGAASRYAEKVLDLWQRLKDIDVAGRP